MPDTGASFRDSPLTRTEHHLSYAFYLLSGISTEGDGRGHFAALLRSAQTERHAMALGVECPTEE